MCISLHILVLNLLGCCMAAAEAGARFVMLCCGVGFWGGAVDAVCWFVVVMGDWWVWVLYVCVCSMRKSVHKQTRTYSHTNPSISQKPTTPTCREVLLISGSGPKKQLDAVSCLERSVRVPHACPHTKINSKPVGKSNQSPNNVERPQQNNTTRPPQLRRGAPPRQNQPQPQPAQEAAARQQRRCRRAGGAAGRREPA